MVERRWLLRLVPPVAASIAAGMLATSSIGAADGAWEPPPCAGGPERFVGAARAAGPATPAELADEAWFKLDPQLDDAGGLSGQRLHIGIGRNRARFVELPPESAAAGPFGRTVLAAADDGTGSTIRAIDAASGCAWALGESSDVVRRVTLAPDASAVYEFRVDRASRADLGVWRRPLDGAPPRPVLPPPTPDDRIGPTWSTTLGWTAEADRLVVQSCGAVRCRTRLLDPASGVAQAVDLLDQGELVGVAGGHAVAYAPCIGLPCPLLSVDLDDATTSVLQAEAGLATLVATDAGPRVAAEVAGQAGTIDVVRPDGTDRVSLHADDGLRVMPGADRAVAGTRVPPGWLVASPDGRSPDGAVLIRTLDGAPVEVREVIP